MLKKIPQSLENTSDSGLNTLIKIQFYNKLTLDEEEKSIIEEEKRVIVEGDLKSFDDMLVIIVQTEPQLHKEAIEESEVKKEVKLD